MRVSSRSAADRIARKQSAMGRLRCREAYSAHRGAAGRKRLRRGKRAHVKKMRCGFTEPTVVTGQRLRRKARQQIPTQKSFVRTRQDERQNSAARLCLMP